LGVLLPWKTPGCLRSFALGPSTTWSPLSTLPRVPAGSLILSTRLQYLRGPKARFRLSASSRARACRSHPRTTLSLGTPIHRERRRLPRLANRGQLPYSDH